MTRALILSLVCLGLTTACDRNNNGGYCDQELVNDYNDMYFDCLTDMNSPNCASSKASFVGKYPQANCRALMSSNASINNTEVTITADSIRHGDPLGLIFNGSPDRDITDPRYNYSFDCTIQPGYNCRSNSSFTQQINQPGPNVLGQDDEETDDSGVVYQDQEKDQDPVVYDDEEDDVIL